MPNYEDVIYPLYYEDIKKSFYAVWPKTSETFKNQRERSVFAKYTIVAHINPENSEPLLEKIEQIKKDSGHNFRPTSYLHFTFLGLNGVEQKPIDPGDISLIIDIVSEFLKHAKMGSLTIDFNLIRLVAWYYKKPNETKSRDLISDGMVVAMGDKQQNDAIKFLDESNKLAEFLQEKLPSVFDEFVKRSHQTIWCTLGYFDEENDFLITKELYELFTRIRDIKLQVNIDRLNMIKFRWKSLAHNHEITSFPL